MLTIDLDGHTALVTGGAAGIGAAVVAALQQAGAHVVAVDIGAFDAVRPDVAINGDITDETVRSAALGALREGAQPILVNNAGIQFEKDLHHTSEKDLTRIFGVNVLSAMLLTREFAADRPAGGSIVNIASVLGVTGDRGLAAYSATKGAIVNFTRTATLEYAGRFRVNAVLPGAIRTPLTTRAWESTGNPSQAEHRMSAIYPLGRIGEPTEVGPVVAFLASDYASFINGSLLTVDGGLLAANAEWGLERL